MPERNLKTYFKLSPAHCVFFENVQLFKLSNKAIDKLPVNIATNLPNGFDMLKRTGSKENFIVTLVLHSLTIYSAE